MKRVASPWHALACVWLAGASLSCTSRLIDLYVSPDADGTRRPEPAPGEPVVAFRADAREVYCVAEFSNGREDATIEGVLRQQSILATDGTQTTGRDIVMAAMSDIAPVGAQQRVSLSLRALDDEGKPVSDAPLPGGRYQCEFALLTEPVPRGSAAIPQRIVQFDIIPLDCPPARILPGSECTFYTEGIECRADGSRSALPEASPVCTCTSGSWACL